MVHARLVGPTGKLSTYIDVHAYGVTHVMLSSYSNYLPLPMIYVNSDT